MRNFNGNKYILVIILIYIQFLPGQAKASLIAPSIPLPVAIAQSDIIVVARLVGFKPNTNNSLIDEPKYKTLNILNPSAQYSFQALMFIKGKCPQNFKLNLPQITANYYNYSPLHFSAGNTILLLLKGASGARYMPVDNTVPFIPLADHVEIKQVPEGVAQNNVVTLLVSSLAESSLRQCNVYMLRDIIDTRLPKQLRPYLHDPIIATQDNVLYCLATNQDVTVIPLIAQLSDKLWLVGDGPESLLALQSFKKPNALPYLNILLFKRSEYTRINVIPVLRDIADHSSIPYLMLAMRDPEPQQEVSYIAYATLHRIIPTLGRGVQNAPYYYAHQQDLIAPLSRWWSDELSGKHLSTGQATAPVPAVLPKSLDALNPMLFTPSLPVRLAVIKQLDTTADKSSIPYLVLALQDPNTDVAYGAYKTLHRLISTLGPIVDINAFAADTPTATQPLYTWWSDELLGKHMTVQASPDTSPVLPTAH